MNVDAVQVMHELARAICVPLLLTNSPDCIQTRGDKLLEDVEPEVRHRKTESVELSRAAVQISMSIEAHTVQ